MDHLIRFLEGGEVALHLVADCPWLMLCVQVALVTPSWTCFLGLDNCFEVGVDDEGRPGAIGVFAEVGFTPLSWLGHHEDLTAALQTTTVSIDEVEYVFTLEMTQARLTPVERIALCCFDVSHEEGEILNPPVASIDVAPICPARLPIEKVNGVGVWLAIDVDRCPRHLFVIPEGGEVDAHLELALIDWIWS